MSRGLRREDKVKDKSGTQYTVIKHKPEGFVLLRCKDGSTDSIFGKLLTKVSTKDDDYYSDDGGGRSGNQ